MNQPALSAFVWSVADLLRGDHKRSEYGKVILPFTVLRRLDCMLQAKNETDALELFRRDLGAFLRVCTFLSQTLDYGNFAIEKRAIFFGLLLPLLEFGRERGGGDLSGVVLTQYRLDDQSDRTVVLTADDSVELQPMTESGRRRTRIGCGRGSRKFCRGRRGCSRRCGSWGGVCERPATIPLSGARRARARWPRRSRSRT